MKEWCKLILVVVLVTACTPQGQHDNNAAETEEDSLDKQHHEAMNDDTVGARVKDTLAMAGDASTDSGSDQSKDFASLAWQANLKQVRFGEAVTRRAKSKSVRELATRIVTNCHDSNIRLQAIAQKKNWGLPQDLCDQCRRDLDELQKMNETTMEQAYLNIMVVDHEANLKLFRQATTALNDDELKGWADRQIKQMEEILATIRKEQKKSAKVPNP